MFPKTLKQKKALYIKARAEYTNNEDGSTILTDPQYDQLERLIRSEDPEWPPLKATGYKVKKEDTDLAPNYMVSLDKAYPDTLDRFVRRIKPSQVVVAMPKYDGSSVRIRYKNMAPIQMVTRGDGMVGGDISFMIPFINAPRVTSKRELEVRCEVYLPKSLYQSKYKKNFDTARAAANGAMNRDLANLNPELMQDLVFMPLGVFGMKPTMWRTVCPDITTMVTMKPSALKTALPKLLTKLLATDIPADGLVIMEDVPLVYPSPAFPEFAFAYKENSEGKHVTVRRVIWQVAGSGRLTPKVMFDPTDMDGASVKHATAHNVRQVLVNGIGPGAVIEIVMGGDIIPYIQRIVKRAKPQMPEVEYEIRGAFAYAINPDEETSERTSVRALLKYIRGLGLEEIADKGLHDLYGAGVRDIHALCASTLAELQQVLGKAKAITLYNQIRKMPKPRLSQIMAYSGALGESFGMTLVQKLEAEIDLHLFLKDPRNIAKHLQGIPDFGPKRVSALVKRTPALIAEAKRWRDGFGIDLSELEAPEAPTSNALAGRFFSWTGYRSPEQEAWVIDNGGAVISLGKRTTDLFYNPAGKFMTKVDRAKVDGIRVWSKTDFPPK